MKPVDRILERARNISQNGSGWLVSCPVAGHGKGRGDRNPSVSVTEGQDGRVLVRCHAGCETSAILTGWGLTMGDLFETRDGHEKMRDGKPTAVWRIHDSAGVLHAEHVRYDRGGQKQYLWRLPGASGWGLAGRKVDSLPLYRSEHVACWPEDVPVVITEGEPAAAALASLYPATLGTVTGAHSTPGPEALDVLRGRNVVLWADNDEPGREHMRRVATALQGVAKTVRIYEWLGAPFPGADAADHPVVASRSGYEALLEEWRSAPVWSPETAAGERVGTLVEDVAPERVSWLWQRCIPLGKVTLIDGDPGTGKSALTTDLAARVSVGRMFPDGTPCRAGGVVIASAEDGLADTIRPRLEAAGADLSRVLALATVPDGDTERLISVPEDIGVIRRGIEQVQARLVVIDPFMAFLSGGVNSHRDQDVRRALAPLAKLAEETGAAVVVVRHLNKSSDGNALYRGGGSIGIIGQARSALLVARHPEDDRRWVLASLKSNLAEPAPSLAFTFTEAANGAVRVEWKGATPLNANALLAAPMDDEERREMVALRDALVELLEGCGGSWEGTPTELHDLLAERDLAALPDRPDELTKRLLNLARAGTAFTVSRGWRGKERVLRLHQHHDPKPPNGVGGVGAIGEAISVAKTTYTTNTTNSDGNLSNGVGGSETALGPLERRERRQ